MWNSESEHAQPEQQPIASVHCELQKQISAQPLRSVVETLGRDIKLAVPCQAQKTIPQILALHQNEQSENRHDAGRLQHSAQRSSDVAQELRGGVRRRRDLNWDWLFILCSGQLLLSRGLRCRGQVLAEIVHGG